MTRVSPDPLLPRQIGSFRLLEVIGEGGMGVVYRAENVSSGEQVAFKTVKRLDPRMLSAMRSEISALGAIRHPGVVKVVADGQNEGVPWYAMELLRGRTLSRFNREIWQGADPASPGGNTTFPTADVSAAQSTQPTLIPGGPASDTVRAIPERLTVDRVRPLIAAGRLREVLRLYLGLCGPLAFVHGRGIVHRDLKPSNVCILSDGTPVLMDFGLMSYAKGAHGREILSGGHRALGTLSYVSPEQALGRLVDARSDLYALGCMLFETLTGRPPFQGNMEEILNLHLRARPVPLSELVDGTPPDLDRVVLGLLAKEPQHRIGHADDVAAALEELVGESNRPAARADTQTYLYRPRLAGREDVLGRLMELQSEAEGGHGALFLIGGESGIGKTFLMAEFAQRARLRNVRVVTGECLPVAASGVTVNERLAAEPLHPLRRFFQAVGDVCREGGEETAQRVLGDRRAVLVPYAPDLSHSGPAGIGRPADVLEGAPLPAQAARERILLSLTETLAAFAGEGQLLLVIDDLQWADDLTISFLASLPRSFFETRRLLVVGTYRTEEVGADLRQLVEVSDVEKVVLERLEPRVVGAIVKDMLAVATPPEKLVDFLAQESEGNPFFVAEYLRLLVAEGVLDRSNGRWLISGSSAGEPDYRTGAVPRSIQDLVGRRLARLDDESRNIVEAASVLGREFDTNLLAALTGLDRDRVSLALREAASRQVTEEVEGALHRFMHDKLRETAYAGVSPERAVDLHKAAANAIEERHAQSREFPRFFPDLAHHLARAGDVAKTVYYLDRAACDALAKSANRDAITFFKEAIRHSRNLEAPGSGVRTARWYRQIADALHGLGHLEESALHAREAAALLGWPSPASRIRLGFSLSVRVLRQVAHRILPQRFLRSRRHDSERLLEAARTHDRLMQGAYFTGDVLVMFHACVTTLNMTEMADTAPELTTAYANAFAVAGVMPARRLAESYYREASKNLENHPDPEKESYLRMLGALYRTGIGSWSEVSVELDRGLSLAQDLRFLRRWEELCSVNSISLFLRGEFAQSLQRATAVCQSASRGDLQTLCWGRAERAQSLMAQNRTDEALAELEQVEPLLDNKELGRTERLWIHALLARARLRQGDHRLALQAGDRAFKEIVAGPPISFAWVDAYGAAAEVFIELWQQARVSRTGDEHRLKKRARRVCNELRPMQKLFPVAAPCRWFWQGQFLWRLGKHDRAITFWQQGLASARSLQMPYDEGLALMALGRARAPSDPARQALLDEAAGTFERLRADYALELLRSE